MSTMGAIGPSTTTNLSEADILTTLISYANISRAHKSDHEPNVLICFSPTMITTDGFWAEENPLEYSLPLFVLQSIIVVLLTRGLNLILSKFRQPRFLAEILGGIILGPSVLGRIPHFLEVIFPMRSMSVLETMAHLGLVFFIFLTGLRIDIGSVSRAGQKAWVLTVFGVILPLLMQAFTLFIMRYPISNNRIMSSWQTTGAFFGVSTAITAYPVLARILAELKLLHTDTGKVAMSSAILNDGIAWVLLTGGIALTGKDRSWSTPGTILASSVLFVVVVYFTVRPAMKWIVSHMKEGETLDEVYVVMVMLGVMVCAILSDVVGIHAIFGAFTMGVVIPNGPLVALLMEKLEDITLGFLLPLFFVEIGVKFNIWAIQDPSVYVPLAMSIFVAAVTRIVVVMITTTACYGVPIREGFALGILMNTKGIMELIILHIALDKKVIDVACFSLMTLTSVILTSLVTPLTLVVHRHSCHLVTYKRRTIQQAKPDSELRMVACIHNTRNVPSTISLLKASNPTKRSPIFVYSVHLIELTGRESAMLIVHDTQQVHENRHRSHLTSQGGNLNRIQAQSEQINKTFETYEQHAGGVSVQPLTIISAYPTMHEDICTLAEDKHATLLILPFHKHHNIDGGMEITNPNILIVNQNVLSHAPCSVAILVDRGLGGVTNIVTGGVNATHNIALLFIGGPDDREALAYAARMVDQPGVCLTVLRLIHSNTPQKATTTVVDEEEKEKMIDEECLKEFRIKTMGDESVKYVEKAVVNGEETMEAIREIDVMHNLYIVGRGDGLSSPLMAGLTDWTENPELGAIGDFLSSSDFTSKVSVLVIQQYKGAVQTMEGAWGGSYEPSVQQAKLVQQEKLRWTIV